MIVSYFLKILRELYQTSGNYNGNTLSLLNSTLIGNLIILEEFFITPFSRKLIDDIISDVDYESQKMLAIRLGIVIAFVISIIIFFLFFWQPYVNETKETVNKSFLSFLGGAIKTYAHTCSIRALNQNKNH